MEALVQIFLVKMLIFYVEEKACVLTKACSRGALLCARQYFAKLISQRPHQENTPNVKGGNKSVSEPRQPGPRSPRHSVPEGRPPRPARGRQKGVSQAPLHAGLGWTGEPSEVCCLVHSGESTHTGGGVTQGRHLHWAECRRRLMHIPKVSPLAPGRAGLEPTQSGSNEDEPHPLHYASGVRQRASLPVRSMVPSGGSSEGGPGRW